MDVPTVNIPDPRSERPGLLRHTGKLMVGFALCMGLALFVFGWDDAVMVARQLSLYHLALLCGLAGLHYLIRAARWHLLVRALGVNSPLRLSMLHFFGGFAMTATPGRLGELVRLRWLRQATGIRLVRLLPIALGDRAIELASLLLLVLGALAFGSLGSNAVWVLICVTLVLVLVFCRPVLLEALLILIWGGVRRRHGRLFAKLRRVIRDLAAIMRPQVLVPVLLLGTIGWALEAAAFWLLLKWLAIPLPLPIATAIFMIAILAGALSGLPGGVGGTEAIGVGLLVLQDIPVESAVLAIIIIRLVTLWFAVFIGLLVFPFAEACSSARPLSKTA